MSTPLTTDELARLIDAHAFLPPKDKNQADRRFHKQEQAFENAKRLMVYDIVPKENPILRERLEAALQKPISDDPSQKEFRPWGDVIIGISGDYYLKIDDVFIEALIAIRDRTNQDFIAAHGFTGDLVLSILAGHRYIDYSRSPRDGWWTGGLEDLLQPLIDKWIAYRKAVWED